MGRLFVLTESR